MSETNFEPVTEDNLRNRFEDRWADNSFDVESVVAEIINDLCDAGQAILVSLKMEPDPIRDMGLLSALQQAIAKARGES